MNGWILLNGERSGVVSTPVTSLICAPPHRRDLSSFSQNGREKLISPRIVFVKIDRWGAETLKMDFGGLAELDSVCVGVCVCAKCAYCGSLGFAQIIGDG